MRLLCLTIIFLHRSPSYVPAATVTVHLDTFHVPLHFRLVTIDNTREGGAVELDHRAVLEACQEPGFGFVENNTETGSMDITSVNNYHRVIRMKAIDMHTCKCEFSWHCVLQWNV